MPEPFLPATGVATVVAGAAVLPVLQAAPASLPQIVINGYALGLRADLLIAGFAGSIVALTFFNPVPSSGDTVRHLVNTTLSRMWWCLASSLTAGYFTPLLQLVDGAWSWMRVPDQILWSLAFVVGCAAQRILGRFLRDRFGVDPGGGSGPPLKPAGDVKGGRDGD